MTRLELSLGARGRVPYALTVGDLNADGAIDVVVGYVPAPSTVFFNDGSGRRFTSVDFGSSPSYASGVDRCSRVSRADRIR